MIATVILMSALISGTPQQLEQDFEEIDQMDCDEIATTIEGQCKQGCDRIKDPTEYNKCFATCNNTVVNFLEKCKETKKTINDFKKKQKDERNKIVQSSAEANHSPSR